MPKIALPFPIPREWGPSTAQAIEDNLQRMFSSSGRIGAGGGSSLVNGLDLIVPAVGSMIVCTTAGLFVALPIVTTAQRSLTNNGGVPTWALVSLSTGVTGVLPLANFFNATATQRLLGRNSAGTGVYEEVTLSQLLDWIGTAAQGDILYRGAATWGRLAAGTAGQALLTNGASADPAWGTPSGSGSLTDLIQQSFVWVMGRPAGPVVFGMATPTIAGSWSSSNQTDGSYVQCTQTGTSINLRAGFDAGARNVWRADNDPTLEFVIQTGATMTNIRLWFLMTDTQISSADDLGGTSKYIGFRYSTVAGDGGWVGVTRDGTTQNVTGTVAAIGASTKYKLKIRKSGSTVFFSVNGGAEVSTSSNLPAAATEFGIDCCSITTSAGSTHPFLFSRARCYYGS